MRGPLAEMLAAYGPQAPKAAVRKRRPLTLMGVAELADTFDVSEQRASQIAAGRHGPARFRAAEAALAGPAWDRRGDRRLSATGSDA